MACFNSGWAATCSRLSLARALAWSANYTPTAPRRGLGELGVSGVNRDGGVSRQPGQHRGTSCFRFAAGAQRAPKPALEHPDCPDYPNPPRLDYPDCPDYPDPPVRRRASAVESGARNREVLHRVGHLLVHAQLEVKVRTCRVAGRTFEPDELP